MAKEYIKREAAIDALQNHYEVRNAVQNGIMDECVMLMMRVPAADVVPVRHGLWIEKRWSTEDDWGVINWHSLTCSVCKHEERTNGLSPNSIYKYDYCPWCSAKMDGETNG